MNNQPPISRVKALPAPKHTRRKFTNRLFLAVTAVLFVIVVLGVSSARAQFPRLGVSASADEFVGLLDVVLDEEFTLYVCVFGVDEQTSLDQEFSSLSWVLHQVCCGASLIVESVDYNPDFEHEGDPYMGVLSSSEVCVDEPFILLATMTMTIVADEDGPYTAACGPYQLAEDCHGENPLVVGLNMILNLSGTGGTPTDSSDWGQLKAMYR